MAGQQANSEVGRSGLNHGVAIDPQAGQHLLVQHRCSSVDSHGESSAEGQGVDSITGSYHVVHDCIEFASQRDSGTT